MIFLSITLSLRVPTYSSLTTLFLSSRLFSPHQIFLSALSLSLILNCLPFIIFIFYPLCSYFFHFNFPSSSWPFFIFSSTRQTDSYFPFSHDFLFEISLSQWSFLGKIQKFYWSGRKTMKSNTTSLL